MDFYIHSYDFFFALWYYRRYRCRSGQILRTANQPCHRLWSLYSDTVLAQQSVCLMRPVWGAWCRHRLTKLNSRLLMLESSLVKECINCVNIKCYAKKETTHIFFLFSFFWTIKTKLWYITKFKRKVVIKESGSLNVNIWFKENILDVQNVWNMQFWIETLQRLRLSWLTPLTSPCSGLCLHSLHPMLRYTL